MQCVCASVLFVPRCVCVHMCVCVCACLSACAFECLFVCVSVCVCVLFSHPWTDAGHVRFMDKTRDMPDVLSVCLMAR